MKNFEYNNLLSLPFEDIITVKEINHIIYEYYFDNETLYEFLVNFSENGFNFKTQLLLKYIKGFKYVQRHQIFFYPLLNNYEPLTIEEFVLFLTKFLFTKKVYPIKSLTKEYYYDQLNKNVSHEIVVYQYIKKIIYYSDPDIHPYIVSHNETFDQILSIIVVRSPQIFTAEFFKSEIGKQLITFAIDNHYQFLHNLKIEY